MDTKPRDPRYSTPESLLAAQEFNAAHSARQELEERIRKYGLHSISAGELDAVNTRYDNAVRNLPIPSELLAYDSADWPGIDAPVFTGNAAHKARQWSEARLNWCIAHDIWSVLFDDLTEQRRQAAQQGQASA